MTRETATKIDAHNSEGHAAARGLTRSEVLLISAIVGLLALKLLLATRLNIHWDEFYFLSFVHDYLRGDLNTKLQTFHVHFFTWLASLPADETGQIVAGRTTMAVLGIGSALLLFQLTRLFSSRLAAIFAVFAYLSSTVFVEHGASFRVDPLVTFLALAATCLVVMPRYRPLGLVLAGFLAALALVLTIKSVFFVATLGLAIPYLASRSTVAGLRGMISRTAIIDLALFTLAMVGSFTVLYLGHAASLAPDSPSTVATYLQGTATKVLLEEGLLPRSKEIGLAVIPNVLFFLMAIDGAIAVWRQRQNWLPLILALPLLTPLFYRNAYPYYYVLTMAAPALLVGISLDRQRARLAAMAKSRRQGLLVLFIALQSAIVLVGNWRYLADTMAGQRLTLAGVHAIFTKPVPYIDGYGVVARFPRYGFFMSSWGMDQYHETGQAAFPALVAQAQPPLLIADAIPLYHALFPNVVTAPAWQLHPDDRLFLVHQYVQYWGLVFVAGKDLHPTNTGTKERFDIAISGDYRLASAASVVIDGALVEPGATVTLLTGPHDFRALTAETIELRWAEAGTPPEDDAIDLPEFFGAGSPRH